MSDETEQPSDAVAGMQTSANAPVKRGPGRPPKQVVDIDEAAQIQAAQEGTGKSFWFGEIGLLEFKDGTKYHICKRRDFVTDPKLIENLTESSKNPSLKIFPEI